MASTAFAVPGWLHTDGNKIKDASGNTVVLRGVAMIDLGSTELWWGGAVEVIDRLTDLTDTAGNSPGWYTKIIRIPIAPHDSPLCDNSPLTFDPCDPSEIEDLNDLLRSVVDYCASKDVYVIIDWHHMADTCDEVAETNAFWEYIAPRYASDSHVLFELFNEPINSAATETDRWLSVKDDMETWIATVRTYAPHNLILVGTPQYCQILAPVVDNPVSDPNVAYVCHTYPYHWLGLSGLSQSWYTNHIITCAAQYPVICTEWGFTTDENFGASPYHFFYGTITDYGRPLKEFFECYGIGNTAWCASNSIWGSPMFYNDWSLRCGEGEMGCFAKDWLYETSGIEHSIDLAVSKCKVKAGKIQGQDSFEASGTFVSAPSALYLVSQIDVNIISTVDDALVYTESVDFDDAQVVGGKFKYSYKIPRGSPGAITSLKIDFTNKTFSIKTKNIDLTGLASPVRLKFTMANYVLSGDVDEEILNGAKKIIPTRLMRTYQNTLIVTKAKAMASTRPLYDSLSVKGDIAVEDVNVDANEPNLVTKNVVFTFGDVNETNVQTFAIPAGSFTQSRKGHTYTCKKAISDSNDGVVTAKIDLDKCTFTLSVKNADGIYTGPGGAQFGINFLTESADFDETDDYTLP
jgi:hypothetical protein